MPDNRKELIKYRLESARERLNSAEVLLMSKSYKDSIGRYRDCSVSKRHFLNIYVRMLEQFEEER